jgi:hypothetical protein
MHSKSLAVLVVTAVLISSCGGESSTVTTRRDPLKYTSNGNQEWVLTVIPTGPGDLDIPMDCLGGELLRYVGTVYFNDHFVPGPRGVHDNWVGWYDPEYFTSLTTGDTWVFLPGSNNAGVGWIDEATGAYSTQDNHAHIPMQNTTTGQKMQFRLDVHVNINAAGEIKRDFLNFSCRLLP